VKYYKIDSRRVSFREYWHIAHGMGIFIGWINKVLRRRIALASGMPEPQPFRDKVIERESLPPLMMKRFDGAAEDLRRLGFDQFWLYGAKEKLTGGISCGMVALHPAKTATAKVIYALFRGREVQVTIFQSELADGTILATGNKKRDFNPLPGVIVQRHVGESAAGLWKRHQGRIEALPSRNPPIMFAGLEQVAAFEDKLVQKSYDDKIRRGIWIEMTDAEVAALRAQRVPPPLRE
jgi:hypothetical protein